MLLDLTQPPLTADFPAPAFFALVMAAWQRLEGMEMEVDAQGKVCGRKEEEEAGDFYCVVTTTVFMVRDGKSLPSVWASKASGMSTWQSKANRFASTLPTTRGNREALTVVPRFSCIKRSSPVKGDSSK